MNKEVHVPLWPWVKLKAWTYTAGMHCPWGVVSRNPSPDTSLSASGSTATETEDYECETYRVLASPHSSTHLTLLGLPHVEQGLSADWWTPSWPGSKNPYALNTTHQNKCTHALNRPKSRTWLSNWPAKRAMPSTDLTHLLSRISAWREEVRICVSHGPLGI